MRIALLHSFYSSAASSGENVVVMTQLEALASAGHDVVLIGRETDREQQHLSVYPVRAAWRTLTNRGPDPEPLLRRFEPDVVHIHNTVPNLGLQWLPRWEGPVVHTLHNYRPLCANGLLLRDGAYCSLCPDGKPWSAVEFGCYRESRMASLPIAVRNARSLAHNPLLERSDALVVLSPAAQEIYTHYGVSPDRLVMIPNGIREFHRGAVAPPETSRWLAVGRLRAEKGFDLLLESWPPHESLDIVGEGPQLQDLESLATPNVRFLGSLPPDQLRQEMPAYSGLVFPGVAVESALPLVVGEALEAGLPVVFGPDHRQADPLIRAGVATVAHWHVEQSDPRGLPAALARVVAEGPPMRRRAREWYEEHLTMPRWIERLEGLYQSLPHP